MIHDLPHCDSCQFLFTNVLYHPREPLSSENDAKTAKDSNTIEENAKTAKDSNILCVDGGEEGLLPAFSRDPLREVVVLRENERSK